MKRSIFGGLATLTAVTLLGGALASTASASPARDGATRAVGQTAAAGPCAPSNARVRKGTSSWADPNTLTRQEAAAMESANRRLLDRAGTPPSARRPNGSVPIEVHFHGITDQAGHNFVTKKRFKRQIKVLNRAFAGRTAAKAANTPFRFRLASIDRHKNNKWFSADPLTNKGARLLRQMRRELHVGDSRDLNVYTLGPRFPLLGFATFPSQYRRSPKLDGVVLLAGSLPGGNADGGPGAVYNRGDSATHEIGHWLNLYHTFQGGCGPLNDRVADTPRQANDRNIFRCDPNLDTCPLVDDANDPVRNFMNYTDDPCLNHFTQGQRNRMDAAWNIRRALS